MDDGVTGALGTSRPFTALHVAMTGSMLLTDWLELAAGVGWQHHVVSRGMQAVRSGLDDERVCGTGGGASSRPQVIEWFPEVTLASEVRRRLPRVDALWRRLQGMPAGADAWQAQVAHLVEVIRCVRPDLIVSHGPHRSSKLVHDARLVIGGGFPAWLVTCGGTYTSPCRGPVEDLGDFQRCECGRDVAARAELRAIEDAVRARRLVTRSSHADLPLVTVVTPTYQRAAFLPETIQSVLDQGWPRLEYLLIDDGSTDDSSAVAAAYAGRLTYLHHENRGEGATVNRGFALASGKYVMVVNSDDPLLPGCIDKLVAALEARPDAVAAYPDWLDIGPRSEPRQEIRVADFELESMLVSDNRSLGPGALFRTAAVRDVGARDTSYRYAGDLDLWFRLARRGALVHVAEVLATHRSHDGAASNDRGRRIADEVVRVIDAVFADPTLPAEVRRLRGRAVFVACALAADLCGHDRLTRSRLLLRAAANAPLATSWKLMCEAAAATGITNRLSPWRPGAWR